uniref:Glycosyltransferase n=1 Tax=Eubacterium cellulosolvens (strain ATCC 43171 / JCM 9499 / 6) TaxID=633697 RepID=I5AQ96_EUBC6
MKTEKKRVLMVATVPSMIGQFNMNNIQILIKMGFMVDVAADFSDTSVWPKERVNEFKKQMSEMNIDCIQIDFSRSPLNVGRHIRSYKETRELLRKRKYAFVHTHTPIASAVIRMVAHKTGTRVIYTAHGFHFYDGAPLKNWILFYPIEKYLSRYTDVLITINKEDFRRAKRKFKAKKTVYIPGVGVDTEKFKPRESGRKRIREELGLPEDTMMLLSVGELNENKNHESVIKALEGVDNITYVVVGKGALGERLRTVAKQRDVDLRLMGYRPDVSDFYDAADIYILPSICEGLNVSLMEAMASALPCCAGRIRGNVDLIDDSEGGYLFNPDSVKEIKETLLRIVCLQEKDREKKGIHNLKRIRVYDLQRVKNVAAEIYEGGNEHLLYIVKRQQKRSEIGVPIECKLLISVGELSERKNHSVVVEALQSLPDDYWYVVVGKGNQKDKLEKMDTTGRLKVLGFRTDIAELLHASDLFVFPSKQEGLPVALMEALAIGLPVICSKIRGNVDLVNDSTEGFLCDYNCSSEYVRGILEMSKMQSVSCRNIEHIRFADVLEVEMVMQKLYSSNS